MMMRWDGGGDDDGSNDSVAHGGCGEGTIVVTKAKALLVQ